MLNIKNIREGHSLAGGKNKSYFNCYGATLYGLGEKNMLVWIRSEFMEDFLNEHTTLQSGELKKGDILVLKNEYGELEHTALYIKKGTWWHKIGGKHSEFNSKLNIIKCYKDFCDYNKTTIRRKIL